MWILFWFLFLFLVDINLCYANFWPSLLAASWLAVVAKEFMFPRQRYRLALVLRDWLKSISILHSMSSRILHWTYHCCVSGSNTSSDAPCLELEFEKFAQPVLFPSQDLIEEYARSLESTRLGEVTTDHSEVGWWQHIDNMDFCLCCVEHKSLSFNTYSYLAV